jgi:flagellar protein FliS
MYATMTFPAHRSQTAHANAYRQVGVQTSVDAASPHRLVAMLFDGFIENVLRAKAAIAQGQVEQRGQAIGRAMRIVDEGLKGCLDLKGGGALARDLADVYAYVTLRLTQANLRNDVAALDECQAVMEPLRQAWQSIGAQVDGARADGDGA